MTPRLAVIIGAVGLVWGGSVAQTGQPHGMSPGAGMMVAMDSLNRRLDSLVDRMNRTGGSQQISAMAAVINELVAQRKAMHSRMQSMHGW